MREAFLLDIQDVLWNFRMLADSSLLRRGARAHLVIDGLGAFMVLSSVVFSSHDGIVGRVVCVGLGRFDFVRRAHGVF